MMMRHGDWPVDRLSREITRAALLVVSVIVAVAGTAGYLAHELVDRCRDR